MTFEKRDIQYSIITRHGRVTSGFPVWRCVISTPVKQPYNLMSLLSVVAYLPRRPGQGRGQGGVGAGGLMLGHL